MALSLENITELFRFALLLTGDSAAAGKMLVAAVAEMPDELMQLRGEKNRTVWLLRKIRERAEERLRKAPKNNAAKTKERSRDSDDLQASFDVLLENLASNESVSAPSSLNVPPSLLLSFAVLPEPERSTLALFYLDLFEPREQAQFFGIGIEDLCERLGSARKFLQEVQAT